MTRAAGGTPIWPDDQTTAVWLEQRELAHLQASVAEYIKVSVWWCCRSVWKCVVFVGQLCVWRSASR